MDGGRGGLQEERHHDHLVGTFYGHGPTPISIDSSSVVWLTEKVGERTGLITLPLIPFGENDDQKFYHGSITIAQETLERF